MLFSVSKMYLISKTNQGKNFTECLKFNIQEMDSNLLWIGFESQFQKMKKTKTGKGDSNPFVSDLNPFERRNSKSALRERRAFLSMFQTFFGFVYF